MLYACMLGHPFLPQPLHTKLAPQPLYTKLPCLEHPVAERTTPAGLPSESGPVPGWFINSILWSICFDSCRAVVDMSGVCSGFGHTMLFAAVMKSTSWGYPGAKYMVSRVYK